MGKELLKVSDLPTMGTPFLCLQQMYDDILADAPLAKDSHGYAALLNLPVSSQHLSAKSSESCATYPSSPQLDAQNSSAVDLIAFKTDNIPDSSEKVQEKMLLQLTLIKMVLAKVHSQVMTVGMKQKYLEIIRILLKEGNVDSKLIHLLCSSDKQLSHMASKSLVSLMHFQLVEESSLNSAWLTFYSEALSGFPISSWIAECLWTLTYMIREILKDDGLCKGGGLKKLLTPLDSVLEGFYKHIMTYYLDISQDIPISAKATNDLSGFLDLLEILVASRIQVPLNLICQRIVFLDASCVLNLPTSPVHDLIKKKSIMLLKKCILHKAGEDLIKRKTPPSSHQDPHFDKDRLALAGAVLQFVNFGWLNRLPVSKKASHFGGSHIKPEVDICSSPDHVTLRALSLLLLKALEIKIQDSASEVDARAHLESVMCQLLTFLKSHLKPSSCIWPCEHPCMWLSVLFIEQDDDMLEAAKALLTVHLKFERLWHEVGFTLCHSDGGTRDLLMHRMGCNPHCIFLFLLKSIAFDATVLLDFLISSETCFLEYFVRYLKLLVEDWHHFVKISKCFKPASSGDLSFSVEKLSCPEKNTYHSDLNLQGTYYEPQLCTVVLLTPSLDISSTGHVDSQSVKSNRFDVLPESYNTSSLGTLQRLVDYESSEDSEVECVGEECLADMKQTSLYNQTCTDETVLMDVACQTATSDQKMLNTSSPSHCKISPNNPGSTGVMLQKSLECFQQLRESVSRLHGRNLFPYNPGALLKLLTRVDTISKQSESKEMQHSSPNQSLPTC
ncbi:protein Lines homolog 1 [Elgaria multicarinata webbii]|uniref:protein Lines homolog 1 n=1 Tax=Elgaria multicarinata webbii TaxID=159646 RepID=UPI002FCD3AF4